METKTEKTEGATETMGEKLKKAGKKAVDQKTARRMRDVKGAHLLKDLLSEERLKDLTSEDKSGFKRLTGKAKGKAVYVAPKGGRVDLSGFELLHPAVVPVSAETAKEKHLGRVRGQLDFDKSDAEVLEAFDLALAQLLAEDAPAAEKPAAPKKEKKAKAPKAPKAEAAPAETESKPAEIPVLEDEEKSTSDQESGTEEVASADTAAA